MVADIIGEDPVTRAIITRLLHEYRVDIIIGNVFQPRGSQIKNLVPKVNAMGTPAILLTDLDEVYCAPALIRDWLGNRALSATLLFRVACDEAETWLMADRQGIADWLSIDVDRVPEATPKSRLDRERELRPPCKPSLFLMRELAAMSENEELRLQLSPVAGAGKGPAYNTALTPFIQNHWNVAAAAANSDSLTRAIRSIQNFDPL